jgi:hypothetical protein
MQHRHGHRTHKFSVDRWTWLLELPRIHAPRQTRVGEGTKTEAENQTLAHHGCWWALFGSTKRLGPNQCRPVPALGPVTGYLDSRFYILETKRNQTGPGTRPRDRTTITGPKTRLGLGFKVPVLHFNIQIFISFSFSFSNFLLKKL